MGYSEQTFLREEWDLTLRAELYKAEFFASPCWEQERDKMAQRWDKSTRTELDALRTLRDEERSQHLGAIVQEQQGPVLIEYWYELFKFAPGERRRTDELLHASIYLAGAVATYVKAEVNRIRPSLIAPDLAPPIPLPGLPSFPGGHATQMHLMARLLTALAPGGARSAVKAAALAKAHDVSRNRERAGLNYPSDTVAGEALADKIFGALTDEKCGGRRFLDALAEARAEWRDTAAKLEETLRTGSTP